jgi:hypothetical protein
MNSKLSGLLAVSAASLFLSACNKEGASADPGTAAAGGDTEVKCLGIHECKGQSQCDVAGAHACAGQNDCKGKGWIIVPQSECDAKGGSVV